MTKEIRELLETILLIAPVPMDDVKNVANTILEMQKAKGCVIKIDMELSEEILFLPKDVTERSKVVMARRAGYAQAQYDMVNAGYVAVEELI